MTTISAFDYVSIAVSTDEGRYNLNGAYREKDRLIGTDGHRLHMVSGLAMLSEGSFVDGRSAEFVNYERVIPQNAQDVATIKLNKKQIGHLGKILKLYHDRNCVARFTFKAGTLSIECGEAGSDSHGAWSLTVSFSCESVRDWSVKLNLRYFFEALIPGTAMVFGAESTTGPQVLKASIHGSEYLAIIMPIREEA